MHHLLQHKSSDCKAKQRYSIWYNITPLTIQQNSNIVYVAMHIHFIAVNMKFLHVISCTYICNNETDDNALIAAQPLFVEHCSQVAHKTQNLSSEKSSAAGSTV